MWSFLTRNRSVDSNRARGLCRPTIKRRQTVRLALEQLETRFCPSGITFDDFQAFIPNIGRQVELMGTTEDADPGTALSFNGAVSGATTVDDMGCFDAIFTASKLGAVTVSYGGSSRTIDIDVTAPIISINSVVYGSQLNRTVTISGSVLADEKAGLTVTLSGAVSGTATTNSNGGFTYQGNASGPGMVYVKTTDVWGQQSNIAQTYVNGIVPVISNFQIWKNSNGQWVASGIVTGGNVGGLTVNIGGITSGNATVNSDGSFSVIINFAPGATGTVTAATTNGWGQTSGTATFIH